MLDVPQAACSILLRPVVRPLRQSPAVDDLDNQRDLGTGISLTKAQHERTVACTRNHLFHPDQISGRCVCARCGTNWPSDFYLDRHIAEVHDTFFASAVHLAKKAEFFCLVRGCHKRFRKAAERKQHLHFSHMYPTESNFEKMHLMEVQLTPNTPSAQGEDSAAACMFLGGEDTRTSCELHVTKSVPHIYKLVRSAQLPAFPKQKLDLFGKITSEDHDAPSHSGALSGADSAHDSYETQNTAAMSASPSQHAHATGDSVCTAADQVESRDSIDDLTIQISKMTTHFIPRSVRVSTPKSES
eukprot:jgi/Ulvmu1/5194/UM021_0211.1